jgi:arginyl-tRNA--protein-N-Asp/Glu arginylyltransferase
MSITEDKPQLYLSMPHACGYLPNRMASSIFVDPHQPIAPGVFAKLMQQGFRRSGDLIYRPHCSGCDACVPVRVPVTRFRPNRGQQRTWRRNRDLRVRECEPVFDAEQFDLYRRYQAGRHPGSSMDDPDPVKYMDFLVSRHARTRFYEFRLPSGVAAALPESPGGPSGTLVAVAVVDVLPDGLSAVYTYYDPALTRRGLGVYALLWEIRKTAELDLPWLYLGYWIEQCPKMAYKAGYRPLQGYMAGRWTTLTD